VPPRGTRIQITPIAADGTLGPPRTRVIRRA
jgi:hypothetical protein